MSFILSVMLAGLLSSCARDNDLPTGWPEITRETKPWTRWWWHGSALTREGITSEMEAYQKAGIGGLEITPIYGVYGEEEAFIPYLSPQWMDLLLHTLREADRLDLGIDMATGTGWPFGGPWVNDVDASRNLQHKIYHVDGGQHLQEKVTFIQPPYLRAVGSQLYEVHDSFSTERVVARGTRKEPVMRSNPKQLDISQLKQPIGSNENLQALAIDQVVFERSIPLHCIVAYNTLGESIDLTDRVDQSGNLNWIAPEGSWTLYAVFEGWHGKMVERAGPGGEGMVIDHFSRDALQRYLQRFDSAFGSADISSLRGFFNDSYEVDDARGAADWTRNLLDVFEQRRGYMLQDHFPALFGNATEDENHRVLCDYRETISEMLLENFTQPWKEWAHGHDAIVRNQAHGSPANILDLYATVDIPEIEGVEALRIKMASSAGNVTGKKLVSSESATWLNEHFESNLFDIKVALDRFMLNGVNHLFYHGTCYSPPDEPWPGHLFYAAVHLNPRNSVWPDFDALNSYVSRCQSFLQESQPDNDVLLYFPIYDRFSAPGPEMVEHFDGIGKPFDDTAFKRAAETLLEEGYSFDYVSDRQLSKSMLDRGRIVTEGNSTYQTLVVPHGRYMPLSTLERIVSLVDDGATVIFLEGLPESPSGYIVDRSVFDRFAKLQQQLVGDDPFAATVVDRKVSDGRVLMGSQMHNMLRQAQIRRESMVLQKISFARKRYSNRTIYFLVNKDSVVFDGWLPVSVQGTAAVVYNPMTGAYGKGLLKRQEDRTSTVRIRLLPEESLILEIHDDNLSIQPYHFYHDKDAILLTSGWTIRFTEGGPQLPAAAEIDTLHTWTALGTEYTNFSGTAVYSTNFPRPDTPGDHWRLDLGEVHESAEVLLNGASLGTVIGPDFSVMIRSDILRDMNELTVRVSNLMANRIADLDRRNVFWRKFYNVNFPARKSENRKNGLFDASLWTPRVSGLLGPVRLIAQEPITE
jgi:hypothetical protein